MTAATPDPGTAASLVRHALDLPSTRSRARVLLTAALQLLTPPASPPSLSPPSAGASAPTSGEQRSVAGVQGAPTRPRQGGQTLQSRGTRRLRMVADRRLPMTEPEYRLSVFLVENVGVDGLYHGGSRVLARELHMSSHVLAAAAASLAEDAPDRPTLLRLEKGPRGRVLHRLLPALWGPLEGAAAPQGSPGSPAAPGAPQTLAEPLDGIESQ